MNVILIDNFDSFTYNLYQCLGSLCDTVTVARNTEIPFEKIRAGEFSHIVISPGPGDPTDANYFGATSQAIKEFYTRYPMLGVCLGHQGLGAFFGASIVKASVIMHGKTSTFTHSGQGILRSLPSEITVMRYHSLVIDPASIPAELIVDAVSADNAIMAFHHEHYPTYGLQFHPESFRTDTGPLILKNFLEETLPS